MDLISTLKETDKLRARERHQEALDLLMELAVEYPDNPVVQYKTACAYDYLGRERDAVPHYIAAIRNELPGSDLRSAYLGLGSTYRTLGQYAESKQTLLEGLSRFPDADEMKVFLAMTLYNLGEHHQAVSSLVKLITETTSDENILNYGRAILFYAEDMDKTWE